MKLARRIMRSLLMDLLLPWTGVAILILALVLLATLLGFFGFVFFWLLAWAGFIVACVVTRAEDEAKAARHESASSPSSDPTPAPLLEPSHESSEDPC